MTKADAADPVGLVSDLLFARQALDKADTARESARDDLAVAHRRVLEAFGAPLLGCNNGHRQIRYDEGDCPICSMLAADQLTSCERGHPRIHFRGDCPVCAVEKERGEWRTVCDRGHLRISYQRVPEMVCPVCELQRQCDELARDFCDVAQKSIYSTHDSEGYVVFRWTAANGCMMVRSFAPHDRKRLSLS